MAISGSECLPALCGAGGSMTSGSNFGAASASVRCVGAFPEEDPEGENGTQFY